MGAAVTSPVCCINMRPDIEKQKSVGFLALRVAPRPLRVKTRKPTLSILSCGTTLDASIIHQFHKTPAILNFPANSDKPSLIMVCRAI